MCILGERMNTLDNYFDNQMSVKQWVKILIIIAVPIINLIFLFRWAFGGDNPLKNYSRAILIVFSTSIGISIMLGVLGAVLESQSYQGHPQAANNIITAQEEYEKTVEEDLNTNLEILDIFVQTRDDGFEEEFKEIVGKVRNNSISKSYTNFSITCNIYDEDNSIVQTVDIFVESTVPEGETLKFSEWPIHGDASSVKVIKISSGRNWLS